MKAHPYENQPPSPDPSAADTTVPQGYDEDPAALQSSEELDEDRLGVDPLEEGIEPPDGWAAADRHGMTPAEQRAGESLEERLARENPDLARTDIARSADEDVDGVEEIDGIAGRQAPDVE